MKKEKITLVLMVVILLFGLPKTTMSNIIEVSVETDKTIYQLGEEVMVSITAHNPNDQDLILTLGVDIQATYIMDDIYNWAEGRTTLPAYFTYTLTPYNSITWELTHGPSEMQDYSLNIGLHSVVGEVLAVELVGDDARFSEPVTFEVIPEPISILLMTSGLLGIWFRRKDSW